MGVVKCPKCGLSVSDISGECFACGAKLPKQTRNHEDEFYEDVNHRKDVDYENNIQKRINVPVQRQVIPNEPQNTHVQQPDGRPGYVNVESVPQRTYPVANQSVGQYAVPAVQKPAPPAAPPVPPPMAPPVAPHSESIREPKPKNSILSIIALVLAFIPGVCLIGLGLAIFDLIKNKKNKHTLSIIAIVISSLMIIAIGGMSGVESEDTSKSKTKRSKQTEQVEKASDVHETAEEETSETKKTTKKDKKEKTETTEPSPEYTVTAASVYQELQDNQVACKTKYNGKLVELTGIVRDIGTNLYGQEYISFESGDSFSLDFITAYFKNSEMDSIASVSKGMEVTVVGTADVGSMSFKMGSCKITKTKEGTTGNKTQSTERQSTGNSVDNESAKSSVQETVVDDGLSVSQRNAVKKAQSHLQYSEFSYSGLIDQLKFEGFSDEDATYAADNCGADWRDQALKKAKSHLEYSSFSKSGLIDQLKFEGFSDDEATYGVENCGADWFEQAAKKAQSHLEYGSFSKDGLIDQLVFEGFTNEEAEYGATQNGF